VQTQHRGAASASALSRAHYEYASQFKILWQQLTRRSRRPDARSERACTPTGELQPLQGDCSVLFSNRRWATGGSQ